MLDWEDALPEDELEASEKAAAEADLAICLGTSLQITPACNIPLKTLKAGESLTIIRQLGRSCLCKLDSGPQQD